MFDYIAYIVSSKPASPKVKALDIWTANSISNIEPVSSYSSLDKPEPESPLPSLSWRSSTSRTQIRVGSPEPHYSRPHILKGL